jgi:polygalacturonase
MWGAIVTPKLEYIMQGWINVADRGIIGDGSSDVSTALNNLITEVANQGGGVLYFPPGTYILANQVTLQSNVSLIGAERARCILKNTSLGGRINAHVNNVKIANLTFQGVQIYGAIPVQAKGGNVTIENCAFSDCNYTSIDMHVSLGGSGANPGFVIRNCYFYKGPSSSNLSKINIQL